MLLPIAIALNATSDHLRMVSDAADKNVSTTLFMDFIEPGLMNLVSAIAMPQCDSIVQIPIITIATIRSLSASLWTLNLYQYQASAEPSRRSAAIAKGLHRMVRRALVGLSLGARSAAPAVIAAVPRRFSGHVVYRYVRHTLAVNY